MQTTKAPDDRGHALSISNTHFLDHISFYSDML